MSAGQKKGWGVGRNEHVDNRAVEPAIYCKSS